MIKIKDKEYGVFLAPAGDHACYYCDLFDKKKTTAEQTCGAPCAKFCNLHQGAFFKENFKVITENVHDLKTHQTILRDYLEIIGFDENKHRIEITKIA